MNETRRSGLSARDYDRVAEVQELALAGEAGVRDLVALLEEPSWAVRRAVVSALARIGPPAIAPLCETLLDRRSEARLAAAVDALVACGGAVDPAVVALGEAADDPALVCDAAQILGRRKSRESVPVLARWSAHDDDNVAVAAIEALGRIGGDSVVEPLLEAVTSGSFFRIFPAITTLGDSGDARAIAPLASLLDQPLYVGEAAAALGRLGHIAAIAPLAHLLVAEPPSVVRAAARALVDLRQRHAERAGSADAVVAAFTASVPTGAASRVAAALGEADAAEKVALAALLGWMNDESATASLIALLDADPRAAADAREALRSLGPDAEPLLRAAVRSGSSERRATLLPLLGARRSVVPELLLCLRDEDAAVRSLASDALGRAGDTTAVGALFDLLGDDDPNVVRSASGAIQSLGSNETRDRAIAAARSANVRERRAALRIVSYFAYPEAIDVLLEAIESPEERLRDAATLGLALLDDPRATQAILAATRHRAAATRAAACRALASSVSTPAVHAALRTALGDADAWVRYYACQSIGRLHVIEAASEIVALLGDPAGQVRVAAVEAIAKLGGPRALEALERAAEAADPDVRRAAILGLGALRRPEALARLRDAAESEDGETRIVALTAIATSNSHDADALLMRAGSDPDPRVREAAIGLLGDRGDTATRWLVERVSRTDEREAILAALARPADGRIETILSALETADEVSAPLLVQALLRARRPNGNAAVEAALHLQNVHARRAAAAGLAGLGTASALGALKLAASADTDDQVRRIGLAHG